MASKDTKRSSAKNLFGSEQASTEEQAEDTLVRVLEERRRRASRNGSELWSPSVEGEEPLLMPEVPTGLKDDLKDDGQRPSLLGRSKPSVLDISLRVRAMKIAGLWNKKRLIKDEDVIGMVADHAESVATEREEANPLTEAIEDYTQDEGQEVENIFEGVGGDKPEVGFSQVAAAETDADRFINGALAVDDLFNDDTSDLSTEYSGSFGTDNTNEETLPLTDAGRHRRNRRKKGRCRRFLKRQFRSHVWEALRPSVIKRGVKSFVLHTVLLGIVPLLGIAALLFYKMGNPTVDFMQTLQGVDAPLSYWFVFAARQWLTLDLAKFTEFLFVDVLALRSKTAVKLMGPLTTLFAIQSKGWPLTLISWAFIDLFILHGNDAFQQNWFFFTDIRLFSKANPGGQILDSELYLRLLIAGLVAGFLTAVKRTVVALYFGKKTFLRYKARIEKLLVEILVVSEVAELSREMEAFDADSDNDEEKIAAHSITSKWKSMKFSTQEKKVTFEDEASEKDEDDDESIDSSEDEALTGEPQRVLHRSNSCTSSGTGSSGITGIKYLLDRWQEPVNKLDRACDPSIHDILQFRKALTFMDERHPFSRSFGPASTRDECIKSAQATYKRLNALQAESSNLSFNVLFVLAVDEDGLPDKSHLNKLRRVFRPDRYYELSELAFVQSCDAVYRKLRYFRASVGNSSVIDKVLADGLDKVFYFLLFLVICAIMKYNPWTLLISLSTIVLSMAFAIGPSASKFFEGMLLIAARAPYDLGDRILIVSPENVINHGATFSWFVEDISLYSTTLRFAATNEVATVNNGSIAGSRIVNCARSPNALITLDLKFMIYITDDEASVMKDAIQQYISDRPRIWVQLIFFRSEDLDPDDEYIFYKLRVQHRKTWQDATAILRDRADLHKFCYQTGEALGILFDSPIRRLRIYRPGEMEIRPCRNCKGEEEGGDKKETTLQDALASAGLNISPTR